MSAAPPTGKSVLFHIGMPKAASTFLQKQVFPSIENATFLNLTSANAGRLPKFRSGSAEFLAEPEAARAAILEAEEAKVIVSAEGFVGDAYKSFLDHDSKAQGLKAVWPEAMILLIVRRQDRFCASLYGQVLRKGFPYSPARFLLMDKGRKDPQSSVRHFDFRAADLDSIVLSYERLFGEDRVTVIPLELLVENAEAFIETVRQLGPYKSCSAAAMPTENRAYSQRGYRAARYLNALCLEERYLGGKALRWLDERSQNGNSGWRLLRKGTRYALRGLKRMVRRSVDRLSEGDNRKAKLLSDDQSAAILSHYAASNRRLSERRGLDLQRYGYF